MSLLYCVVIESTRQEQDASSLVVAPDDLYTLLLCDVCVTASCADFYSELSILDYSSYLVSYQA